MTRWFRGVAVMYPSELKSLLEHVTVLYALQNLCFQMTAKCCKCIDATIIYQWLSNEFAHS